MTEEEAYEEARRRIHEAERTGAVELDLSGRKDGKDTGLLELNRLPPELVRLTSLQSLDLAGCYQLSVCDLSPLGSLTSLQSLNLFGCLQLSDLSPLAKLTSLQELNHAGCNHLSGDLSPLAELTSLQSLNLSGCYQLSGNLSSLAELTSLQELNLARCEQLSGDLSPLASLTSLQSLDLSWCTQLGDLSLLAKLTSLQSLDLSGCTGFRQFTSLEPLLARLETLQLYDCRFNDLPPEICGQGFGQNVIREVRAHFADLRSGQSLDAELKIFILGNGSVGKTQLSRRLQGLAFDSEIPTTHGIELNFVTTDVNLEHFKGSVRLNLWDFGGQDIYHGSHTLFLHGQAIFLLLWNPEEEKTAGKKTDSEHRPITYWLDYLRSVAGTDNPLIIVQSQCDTPEIRADVPVSLSEWIGSSWTVEVSAKTDFGLERLKATLKDAAWACFHKRPPPPIGKGRLKVRDRLRTMLASDQKLPFAKRKHRLIKRQTFDQVCVKIGGISDTEALLGFLHHNGVLFYRSGLFENQIVLDQNWALEAIYAIFDRKKILPLLRSYGRFSRADLEALIWSGHTPEEQKVFLGMMESCGICFKVRELPQQEQLAWRDKEWEYLAPELLPKWSDAQEQLLGRLRDDPPDAEASARYAFLHEGILRGYLSKLGEHAKDAAIYWKYGCWFFEQTTSSQVLIESQWDAESEAGSGEIRFRAWGNRADDLIEQLLRTLQTLPVGQPPEIKPKSKPALLISYSSGNQHLWLNRLQERLSEEGWNVVLDSWNVVRDMEIPVHPELPPKNIPEIFVSYAWGDDSSQEAHQRTDVVDRLCKRLDKDGWNIIRDKTDMRSGDLISGFMKRIGLADHVIVVLSDKYLRSPYCMTELHAIYQRSIGEKEDFLRRIIPLRLADARFGTWRDRLVYTKHWRTEFEEMEQHFKDLAEADFRLYKAMQEWHHWIGDMLAYVNDVLTPHGFNEIVKDDFAALRQMLQRRQ
jgi:internalin A